MTVLVLLMGLLSMASGEKMSKKFGTKLMTMRVIFQGLAIVVIAIVYFMSVR